MRLFDRNRDGYTLTEAGRDVLPRAEHIEQEMSALERGVAGRDERLVGQVSLTCSDGYVADLLIEGLIPFCEANPRDRASLHHRRPQLRSLQARGRHRAAHGGLGQRPSPHLIGVEIAPVMMASYVARAHAERLDPEGPHARWLGFDDSKVVDQLLSTTSYPHLPRWGAFMSLDLMVRAGVKGLGLAPLPTYVGDQVTALQRLREPDVRQVASLWLLSHPDLRRNARLRAAREAVTTVLRSRSGLFAGACPIDAPVRSEIAPGETEDGFVG